jgi:hypothetical protein
MAKKPSASRRSKTGTRRQPFSFQIEINDGIGGRISRRQLTYPKPPDEWTSIDVLNIARTMAQTAAEVRRVKITDDRFLIWFDSKRGGTEVTVSHAFGAWAFIRGESLILVPAEAIGGLVGVSNWCSSAHIELPGVLPADPKALRQQLEHKLKMYATMRDTVAAKLAEVSAR